MALVRLILMVVAILAVVAGLFFAAQGMGWIMWPADSFMLADRKWVYNGSIIAAVGGIVIALLRRSGR